MRPHATSPTDRALRELAIRLREHRPPRDQLRALDGGLGSGLGPGARGSGGEGLFELCARLGAQEACLALLDLGADPFEAPRSRDARGQFTSLRGFEALLASDLPDAARRAARDLPPAQFGRRALEWVELSRSTHPLARRCRPGGGWAHLCAAAGASDCLQLALRWGASHADLDDMDGGPLLSCGAPGAGSVRCADLLVLAGADLDRADRWGQSARAALPPSWRVSAAASEGEFVEMAARSAPPSGRRHSL